MRKLGLGAGTALVAGNMIGSGIFLLPAGLAVYGRWGLIGWAMASVGAILLAGLLRGGGPTPPRKRAHFQIFQIFKKSEIFKNPQNLRKTKKIDNN